jgi:hypothetical protein
MNWVVWINKLNLPVDQWLSVGKGALIASLGAALAMGLNHLGLTVTTDVTGAFVAAGLAVAVNYLHKVGLNTSAAPGATDGPVAK